MLIPTLYHPLKWVDYSWITIWCSLGLLTNLWPKHPGLKHTESTLTLIMLLSAVTSSKGLKKILQEKHSRRRSSAIITYYQVHFILMLQLNITSVQTSPRYPGSMTPLLRQFVTTENWKEHGTKTRLTVDISLPSTASVG